MADNARLRYLSDDLDESLTVEALDLASYVSASRVESTFICCFGRRSPGMRWTKFALGMAPGQPAGKGWRL